MNRTLKLDRVFDDFSPTSKGSSVIVAMKLSIRTVRARVPPVARTSPWDRGSRAAGEIPRSLRAWFDKILAGPSGESVYSPKPPTGINAWQRAALIGALRDPVLADHARQILFEPMPYNTGGGTHVRSS
jgi:hypothetical protein